MYWNTWKRWKEFAPGWPVCYPLVHKVIKAFQLRPTNGLMESHHIMLLQRWAVSIYFTCFNTCYLRDINFTKCSGKWFVASYNLCVWKLASTLLGLTVWQGISLDHGLVWDSFCPLAVEWITQCSQVPILGTQWLIVSIYPKSFCTNSDINFTMVLGVLSWSFLKLEWVQAFLHPYRSYDVMGFHWTISWSEMESFYHQQIIWTALWPTTCWSWVQILSTQ